MGTSTGDVTAVIAPQHQQVEQLLEQVRQGSGRERAEAFHTLRITLALHETAEEQAVHPQAKRQLGVDNRDVDSEQFESMFDELASSVVDHAESEEQDEWPALREISDEFVVQSMIEQMQAVTQLVNDPAASDTEATFEQMQA